MANYRYLDLEGLSKYNNLLKTWLSSNYSATGHNHDSVYKKIQTAVASPSASGSTNSFIDTISQDAQGKISATKKTLSAATSDAIGGIKIGFTTNATNRNYAVQLSSERAFVNVPWTDANVTNNATTTSTYYLTGSSSNANATGSLLKRADVFVNGSGVISSNGLTLNGNITLGGQSTSSSASSTSQILFGSDTSAAKLTSNGNGNIVINPNSGTTGQIIFTPGNDSKITINSKKVATEDYVKTYVGDEIVKGFAANDAMVFKGTLGADGKVASLPTNGYSAGWTYKVATAGTYAGVSCGIGDMVICVKDYATGASNSDWSVVQNQLDLVGGKDTVGFVKNGSSETSTSGLTACPIISGVPYYKDTNTTSFTITANASDDDVVILSGSNGTNAVTYTASHATQGPSTTANTIVTPAIADNGTTAITDAITPSFGEYVKLSIPGFTVNKYGHVSAAANTTLSFKLPTPTAYSLPLAANGIRGGIQIGFTTSGKNYAVQLSSEKAYVNVPWTDTKVTQTITALPSTAATYPLLFTNTAGATATATDGVRFASGVSLTLKTGDVTLNGVHKIAELDSTVTLSPAADNARPTEFASGNIAAISSIVQTDGKISTGTSGNIMYRITDTEIATLFD